MQEQTMSTKPVVETHKLTKMYGDGTDVKALDAVDLEVNAGEFVAIVGPSGSGKSTLLNLLGALDRPTSGEVIINGTPLSKVRNLDKFRSHTVGFVFQMHNLIPALTALENVEVPLHASMWNPIQRKHRAEQLLDLVHLSHRRHYLPGQMSGGERQRVAIARALANHPALVLADEPTGNLDTQNTADIMKLLQEINATQGATIIAVTHNHEVASATGRVITLRDGRIHSDVRVGSAFDRDLIDLKNSSLGRAIEANEIEALPADVKSIAPALKDLFARL
jgi:ABC-type lipoprotein export system ATPase subunit